MKKRLITIGAIVVILIATITTTIILTSGGKKESNDTLDKNLISITFFTDGGSSVQDLKIEKGKSVELPTTTKDGYNFLGWFDGDKEISESTMFEEDTKLIAKWKEIPPTAKTFTITFDSKGGSQVNNLIVECNQTLPTLPTPTRNGYRFASWSDKHGKVILKGALLSCENVTLYANWEMKETPSAKTFTVTYNSNGGSSVKNSVISCGSELTLPANPTRDGYTFVSWADKNGKVILNGAKLACENITLTANWEKNKAYKCPSGYTLNGTKCTTSTDAKEKCPSDTKEDGALCIRTSDSNSGERVCKEYTVSIDGKGHTWTGKGDYYFIPNAYGSCAYYKWDSYTTQSQCEQANDINHKTKWISYLNGCYAETKTNNYETVCSNGYQYYSSTDLSSKFGIHDNGKCLKKVDKTKYCDNGYTLSNNKCVKTIDATLE